MHEMLTIVTNDDSVGLSVCHTASLGMHRPNGLGSGWDEVSWGSREQCDRWGSRSSHSEGRGSTFVAAFAKLFWPRVVSAVTEVLQS